MSLYERVILLEVESPKVSVAVVKKMLRAKLSAAYLVHPELERIVRFPDNYSHMTVDALIARFDDRGWLQPGDTDALKHAARRSGGRKRKQVDWTAKVLEQERALKQVIPVSIIWSREFDEGAYKILKRITSVLKKGQGSKWGKLAKRMLKKVQLTDLARPSARWRGHEGIMELGEDMATRKLSAVRWTVIHELGHAFEEVAKPLADYITFWGAPPFVSAYAEMNAGEDFAECFVHLLATAATKRQLKEKAPTKYARMAALAKKHL